jgi:DNA-binding MarR family transcriptional regulator
MKDETSSRLVPLVVADIYQLAGAFRAQGEAIARPAGQTQARWQVMSAASAGPRTVPQIARRLGVTRQNVQRIADQLAEEGWARFAPNPDHRSSDHLILTDAGHKALLQLTAAAAAYHVRVAEKFSERQLTALHRGLRHMCAALEEVESPAPEELALGPGRREPPD